MAEVTNAELTSDILNGTGTLDVLMQSISASLDDQFKKGRIQGTDYANVYLGAVTALVPQAVAFVLGKQQADKQAELLQKQIELTNEQILKEALERDSIAQDILIKQKQVAKLDAEIELINTQNDIAEAQLLKEPLERDILIQENLLKVQQTSKVAADITNVNAATAKINKDSTYVDKQIELVEEELLKAPLERNILIQEEDLKEAQVLQVQAQTANVQESTLKITQETALVNKQVDVATQEALVAAKRIEVMSKEVNKIQEETGTMVKQRSKIDAEIELISSKRLTELAQTSSTLPDGEGGTYLVTGIMGKQLELFEAQRKGYADNTKHKAMSTLLDSFTILKSNNDALGVPLGLDDANIDSVINSVRASIGLTASS